MFNIAHAQAAEQAPQGGLFAQLLPLILLVVIFYFLLIRPQQKRNREHREMLEALAVGDEIITSAGMMGTVTELHDTHILVNLGDSKVRMQKQFVQSILPKGTL